MRRDGIPWLGQQRRQAPDRHDEPEHRHAYTAADGRSLEVSITRVHRWSHDRHHVPHPERCTEGQEQPGQEVFAEEHREHGTWMGALWCENLCDMRGGE